MTIDLGATPSLPQWLPWQQVITPCNTYYCVFLDKGDVYKHQTLHKFYPLYGCHGNIIIMLPWQPSKMFVTGRKWPQTINQMCSPPLPQSSMVAMATLNNPSNTWYSYYLTMAVCMSIKLCTTYYWISTAAMATDNNYTF